MPSTDLLTRLRLIAPTLSSIETRSDEELASSLRQLRMVIAIPAIVAFVGTAFGGWIGTTIFVLAAIAGMIPLLMSRQVVQELLSRDAFREEQAVRAEQALLNRLAVEDAAMSSDEDEDEDEDEEDRSR